MPENLKTAITECILNHGHIMIGYFDLEKLMKYIDQLEKSKDFYNEKISELYGQLAAKDTVINEYVQGKN